MSKHVSTMKMSYCVRKPNQWYYVCEKNSLYLLELLRSQIKPLNK